MRGLKVVAVMLAVTLLMGLSGGALASSTPSKGADDLVIVSVEGSGSSASSEVTVTVQTAPTGDAGAEVASIRTHVQGGASVVSYFSSSVQSQIKALLPAGIGIGDLKVKEVIGLGNGASIPTGFVARFTFPTQFPVGGLCIATVGIVTAPGSTLWFPVRASVVPNYNIAGQTQVRVAFPYDLTRQLALYSTRPVVMAVLGV